jgi:CAAX protease family protein
MTETDSDPNIQTPQESESQSVVFEDWDAIHPTTFGWIVLFVSFFSYLFFGGIVSYLFITGEVAEQIQTVRIITSISQILFLLLPAILLLRLQPWKAKTFLKLRLPRTSHLLLSGLLVITLQLPLQGYILLQRYLIQTLAPWDSIIQWYTEAEQSMSGVYTKIASAGTPVELVFVFIVVALTPAFCEELLFRGVVLGSFRRGTRLVPAVLVSGVMFSLFHMNPVTFIPLAVLGVVLAIIVIRTGSIVSAMLAHACNNSIAIISLYFFRGTESDISAQTIDAQVPELVLVSLLGLCAFAIVMVVFWISTRPQEQI